MIEFFKKGTALCLSVLMILSTLPTCAFSEDSEELAGETETVTVEIVECSEPVIVPEESAEAAEEPTETVEESVEAAEESAEAVEEPAEATEEPTEAEEEPTEAVEEPIEGAETVPDVLTENEPAVENDADTENPEQIPASGSEPASVDPDPEIPATVSPAGAPSVENAEIGADPGNSSFSRISFSFSDGEKEYQCTINGLRNASVSPEGLEKFCNAVAQAFLNGDKIDISNTQPNPGGLKTDPIDAEKMNRLSEDVKLQDILTNKMSEASSGMPYGDYSTCWAASAADMLEYSGWREEATGSGADEDGIYSIFSNKYFDQASSQEYGIKWFFDGVNETQSWGNDGNASYYDWYDLNTAVNGTWAQRRYPGFDEQGVTPQNYKDFLAKDIRVQNYAAESFLTEYDLGDEDADTLSDMIVDSIEGGDAVGITVNYLKKDRRGGTGAHALTAFGFIKEALATGLEALKALFVADSDSDIPGGLKNPGQPYDSASTEADRRAAENKYTMYLVRPTEDLSDRESFELVDYVSETYELDTVFATVTFLESSSKKTAEDAEAKGTKNPVTTMDLVPTNTFVSNSSLTGKISEGCAGETVVLSGVIRNSSLVGIDTELNPIVKCTYSIYKDGKLYDTYHVSSYLSASGYRAGGYSFTYHYYRFASEGEYSISYSVDGLYDSDGNLLSEAYTVNNDCRFDYSFTVKPGHPHDGPTGSGSLRAYAVDYSVFGLGEHARIELEDGVSFIALYFNGLKVDEELYTLKHNDDGTWSVELSPEYIKELGTGNHIFDLKTSAGETIVLLVHIT